MKKSIAIILSIMLVLAITFPAAAISSIPVKSIKLNDSKITLKVGQTSNLKVTFTPANTSQKMLSYATDNKNVATVDLVGKITGVSAGNTTITVITPNKDIFAKCNVTILPLEKTGPPVELTVEVFDRATPGYVADNNFQTKWIQKKFGTPNNINVKFVPVPRSQEVDKLNILMAANQAPDICFTYSEALMFNYVKNDGLTDLTGVLDQYGPNLKKYLGDTLLAFGKWDNKQLAIPAKRIMEACLATFIRKDWLDKLGLPIPKTTEEFYNTMKAFKEKDPGMLGDKVIPFTFNVDPNNIDFTTHTIMESFKKKVSEEDRMTLPNWVIPGYKEGMKFMNKMYNDGLLNTQFALDKDGKQYEKDISQGKVGAFIKDYDFPYRTTPGLSNELKKNVPGGQLIPIDPFTNFEGKHPKMKYNPNGLYLIVPKSSKHATEAMKYLEWMSNPDVLRYLQNGVKGNQYTAEIDGIPTKFIPNNYLSDAKKANYLDLSIIVNGKEFGSKEKNMKAASLGYPGYEIQYKQAYSIAMADANYIPHFDKVIESLGKYQKSLSNVNAQIFTRSIICKPTEFDKTYDELVQEYLKTGGQEIIDEKKIAFKAMKK